MATAVMPLVVLVAGALLFALSSNPKLAKMGEYAYFVGLFWARVPAGKRARAPAVDPRQRASSLVG